MPLKCAIFDIDGTLIDSNQFHVQAWYEAIKKSGASCSMAAIHKEIGKGADMLLPALFPDMSEAQRHEIASLHDQIFAKCFLHRAKPFPSAKQLLSRLAGSGIDVVLASSAKKSEAAHYIALLDVEDILTGLVTGDDVAHSKPAADIFATALRSVAPISVDAAITVGDSPYDIESAARAHLRTIAVRSGGFSDDELQGAVAVYDNVRALLRDFDRWTAQPMAGNELWCSEELNIFSPHDNFLLLQKTFKFLPKLPPPSPVELFGHYLNNNDVISVL